MNFGAEICIIMHVTYNYLIKAWQDAHALFTLI